jgi:hypothetical protein
MRRPNSEVVNALVGALADAPREVDVEFTHEELLIAAVRLVRYLVDAPHLHATPRCLRAVRVWLAQLVLDLTPTPEKPS